MLRPSSRSRRTTSRTRASRWLGAFSVLALGGALTGTASTGCGASCDRTPDVDHTRFEGGSADGGFYETSGWEGPYVDFPAGRTVLVFHRLGGPPRSVVTYLAFERNPLPPPGADRDGHSNTAVGAGNQVEIEEVTAEYVRVHNDTCSDAFLRVTASDPAP